MELTITRTTRNPIPDVPYVLFEITTRFTFSQRERELWLAYSSYVNTPIGRFLESYGKRNSQGQRTTIGDFFEHEHTFTFGSVDEATAMESSLRAMLVETRDYFQRVAAWETTTETVQVPWDGQP